MTRYDKLPDLLRRRTVALHSDTAFAFVIVNSSSGGESKKQQWLLQRLARLSSNTTDGKFDLIGVVDVTGTTTTIQASQNPSMVVKSLDISSSVQTSLLGPLQNIVNIRSDKYPTNDIAACYKLSSFIKIVNIDQRKGILTMEQVAQLRQLATNIMVKLGS